MPLCESHEQHILKTAQRLEELNSWVSQELEPWETFHIYAWYSPYDAELTDGISVYFTHAIHSNEYIYEMLLPHIQTHEALRAPGQSLIFQAVLVLLRDLDSILSKHPLDDYIVSCYTI